MGKGKKRKNPGVGVDFRKVKHKVGKKLAKAQNETRTDFQARSINLPSQSINQDKAGAAVSERNLTLKELLSQLPHHNTSTRRDALTGLQQLLTTHPAEARRHPAPLLEALAPRLSDGEPSVRTSLLTCLRSAVLPALGPSALSPFMPLLLAHVSAALTNLSADVRLDALSVLEAVTEAAPGLMAQSGVLGAALGHYGGLLSRANRGKSVKSQALAGLLKVVASLDKFLTVALAAVGSSSSTLPAAGASDARGSDGDVLLLLQGQRATAAPAGAAQIPSVSLLLQLYCPAAAGTVAAAGSGGRWTPGKGGSSSSSSHKQGAHTSSAAAAAGGGGVEAPINSSSSKPLQEEVLSLLDVLFDVWSEAAPGSLSTAPEAEATQVLLHILSASHLLISHFSPTASSSSSTAASYTGRAGAAGGVGGSDASLTIITSSGVAFGSGGPLCPGFNTRRDQLVWLQQAACIVLPRLTKVFPVNPPASRGLGPALYDGLQQFNLLGMQLCAGFMASGVSWPPQQHKQQRGQLQQQEQWGQQQGGMEGPGVGGVQQQEWQQRLLSFMTGVLAAGNCLPSLEQAAVATTAGGRGSNTPGGSKAHKQQQQQQQQQPSPGPAGPSASFNSSLSSSSILVAVLQTLQQLLPQLTGPPRRQILAALSQLAAAAAGSSGGSATAAAAAGVGAGAATAITSSSSGGVDGAGGLPPLSAAAAGAALSNSVRSACLRLQLLLLQQHLWTAGSPYLTPEEGEEAAMIAGWLAAAPKLLYELGSGKPRISALLLQLLFEAARLSGPGVGSGGSGGPLQQQLQQLQPQLAALLVTPLPPPSAGKQAKQQAAAAAGGSSPAAATVSGGQVQPARVLLGPLVDLPPSCQVLAIDTLAHLPSLTPCLIKAVALTPRISAYPDTAVLRLLDGVLAAAAAAGSMAPDAYASFVVTLLSPGPLGGYVDRVSKKQVGAGFRRHQLMVDTAVRWLHGYGPLQEMLLLLTGPLLLQWQQQQQDGVGGAAGQQQQQVCCLTYSLVALAAVAAGCWVPSSSSTTAVAAAAAAAAVPEACVPPELLCVLPNVLATHCLQRASADAAAASSSSGSSSGESAAAATAAATMDCCLCQLVLPLATTLPSSNLLMPFLQQLVQQGLAQQQQQGHQQQQQPLVVVLAVLKGVLGHQGLRVVWVQQEGEVGVLLQQLQEAGRQLQQQGGDGAVLKGAEELQTAMAMLCKH